MITLGSNFFYRFETLKNHAASSLKVKEVLNNLKEKKLNSKF